MLNGKETVAGQRNTRNLLPWRKGFARMRILAQGTAFPRANKGFGDFFEEREKDIDEPASNLSRSDNTSPQPS